MAKKDHQRILSLDHRAEAADIPQLALHGVRQRLDLAPTLRAVAGGNVVVDQLALQKPAQRGRLVPGKERTAAVGVDRLRLPVATDGIDQDLHHVLAGGVFEETEADAESAEVVFYQ